MLFSLGYDSTIDRRDEQKAKLDKFLETLMEYLSRSSTK